MQDRRSFSQLSLKAQKARRNRLARNHENRSKKVQSPETTKSMPDTITLKKIREEQLLPAPVIPRFYGDGDEEMPMDEYQHHMKEEMVSVVSDISFEAASSGKYPVRVPDEQTDYTMASKHTNVPLVSPKPQNSRGVAVSRNSVRSSPTKSYFLDAADRGGGHLIPPDLEISQTSSNSDSTSMPWRRLASAIRFSRTPTDLTPDEMQIWNAVQQTLMNQRAELTTERRAVERKLQESTQLLEQEVAGTKRLEQTVQSLELKLQQTSSAQSGQQEELIRSEAAVLANSKQIVTEAKRPADQEKDVESMLEEQEEGHNRSILAMQRVLADITSQRDEMEVSLRAEIAALKASQTGTECQITNDSKALEDLKKQLSSAEKERDELRSQLGEMHAGPSAEEFGSAQQELQIEQTQKEVIQKRLDEMAAQLETVTDDAEKLRAELAETRYELERARNAPSSDQDMVLRQKLRTIALLETESANKQKVVDRLAMEVSKIQRDKEESDRLVEMSKKQEVRQRNLTKTLEKAITDLEGTTKLEKQSDQASSIVRNSLLTLKVGLAAIGAKDVDEGSEVSGVGTDVSLSETSVGAFDSKELERHLDFIIRNDREAASEELRAELEQKTASIKVLEESLRKQKHEAKMMKKQNQLMLQAQERAEARYRGEVALLMEQREENLQILSKKHQELEVLRSTLKEEDVGYISGDDSDDEFQITTHLSFATNGGVEMSTVPTTAELALLKGQISRLEEEKDQLFKDFRHEQESLTNAKLIISSLEKANKTMLEDLKSRLSDSNIAIQSLLDKSMENEKISKELKLELDQVRQEKAEEAKRFQEELERIEEESRTGIFALEFEDPDGAS